MNPEPSRPHRLGQRLALALTAASAAFGITAALRSGPDRPQDLTPEIERRWIELWSGLDALAARSASALAGPLEPTEPAAFRRLERLLPEEEDRSLFLLDAFGLPLAWAGGGLAHEVTARALPPTGHAVRASFTTVTLLSVAPIAETTPAYRVAAAVSFPTDRLPFPIAGRGSVAWRWSAVTSEDAVGEGTEWVLRGPETPLLLLSAAPDGPIRRSNVPLLRGAALATLGLASLLWAWMRHDRRRGPRIAGSLAAVGLLALAAGAAAPGLVAIAGLAGAAAVWGPRRPPRLAAAPALLGGLAGTIVLGAAWSLQRAAGPVDLGHGFLGGAEAVCYRLALWGLAFALLGLITGGRSSRRPPPPWPGALLLLLAAATVDVTLPAVAALLAGAALVGPSLARGSGRPRGGRLAAVALLAALLPAIASEAAYRDRVRTTAPARLARLEPPTREQLEAADGKLIRFFAGTDVTELSPAAADTLESGDLAYAIWRRAPLRHDRALSGVAVAPAGAAGSSFALGLSIADGELIDWPTTGAGAAGVHLWDYTLLTEEASLALRGSPWAGVRYWLLPQPGFGVEEARDESLSRRLLRGGPGMPRTVEAWLSPLRYAFYDLDGPALVAPWKAPPPLPASLAQGGTGLVATPAGRAQAWTAAEPDGVRALFLPRLGPLAALERVGTDATGALFAALALALVGLAAQNVQPAARARLWRPMRSYSVRLMVLFALLLLVPAVVVNLLLLRTTATRLEADRLTAGEDALEAAERVLGDYAAAQAPGVAFDTVLDDQLLDWLASVVRYEVNLYFGGTLYATSKRALFTAGLLPERIPGGVYSRLAVEGHAHAIRRSRVGDLSYREIYAPLPLPGPRRGSSSLVVSVPMLGQEEEIRRELGDIQRKILLATVGLLLLLAALGARLARSFTTPLTDILEGTRRIAGGSASLGVRPPPLDELATLVDAIDRMAVRIAQTRSALEREKQVMSSMLESITSAVVSLDSRHRVMMQNEVAGALLGSSFDRPLDEALAADPRLAVVREFVAGPAQALRSATVRLPPRGEEEPEEWTLSWVPVAAEGDPAALLVVEDVSEVLRGQRLAAWAEMARMIAHEIKNPLTPIRLSAEHMREVRLRDPESFDEVFARCTRNILAHVDELQEIASDFSIYSRIPRIEREEGDLSAFTERLVDGYRTAPPPGVQLVYEGPAGPLTLSFDPKLLGRALRNLIENALRAVAEGGTVAVRLERTGEDEALLQVEDDGPGVPEGDLDRIFEPYFSTHDTGTGLGLPIARRVVEEHGGRIAARNVPGGGLRVLLRLPAGGPS